MEISLKSYRVETKESKTMPYIVYGPKITVGLVRNVNNPERLGVINGTSRNHKLAGYEWFTDKNGIIEPLS